MLQNDSGMEHLLGQKNTQVTVIDSLIFSSLRLISMHIGKGKQKSRERSKIFLRTHKLVERGEVMQLETSYIPFRSKSVSERHFIHARYNPTSKTI